MAHKRSIQTVCRATRILWELWRGNHVTERSGRKAVLTCKTLGAHVRMAAAHKVDTKAHLVIFVIRLRQSLHTPFDERFACVWLRDKARVWNVGWALEADYDLLASYKRRLGLRQTTSSKEAVLRRSDCGQVSCSKHSLDVAS
jgi:hypothetical protein